MIYWEHVNPRFYVGFHTDNLDFDVWFWDDPEVEGWTNGTDQMGELGDVPRSPSFPEHLLSHEINGRLKSVVYPHYMVVYGRDIHSPGKWVFGLVATEDSNLFIGFNTQPPAWYLPDDGLTPFQRMLNQVNSFTEIVRRTRHSQGNHLRRLTELETTVEGYCTGCGLHNDKHVSHKVPGYEGSTTFNNPEEARPYYQAFRKHYQGALMTMTDGELLAMPLPPNARNLRIVALEVQRRIDSAGPAPTPKSAMERLLVDDLFED